MRAVADSNVVVSGLLWGGASRQILDSCRQGKIRLFTTGKLILELSDVLQRRKFARRFELAGVSPNELVYGYAALARVVEPAWIEPVVLDDPDDDAVLACAVAAEAAVIVSGDHHLLDLKEYRAIRIVSPRQLLDELQQGTITDTRL